MLLRFIASAVAMPAVATGHGDQRMAGEQLVNATTKMTANSLLALFTERARQFTNDKSQNSSSTDKLGNHTEIQCKCTANPRLEWEAMIGR